MASERQEPASEDTGKHREVEEERRKAAPEENGQCTVNVVGLGASAGGLKPLRAFFEEIPPDTGFAFVVVVHLSPDRESSLAELIGSVASISVEQVTGRAKLQPNHVYIIPPGKNIELADGYVGLTSLEEPRISRAPIDHFFRSLAHAHPDGTGIILSGGGTDGTVGMKDIKQEGGVLMVQDPSEAEHKSMPRSAISTGLIDFVLPVKELGKKVVELSKTPDLRRLAAQPEELPETDESVLQKILEHLQSHVGHDFSGYKRSTVLRRLARRMHVVGVDSLSSYLGYLNGNDEEAAELFGDLLISVTCFFRDEASWDALAEHIIPKLFEGKSGDDELRAWVPGCATGEEAYTLGMLLLEHADTLSDPPDIQMFACDLNEAAISVARFGTYPASIAADVSPERLKRFFTRKGDHYRVDRELRDLILFAPHDVLKDAPFSRQDLIACRNLLIYLQRDLQEKVLEVLHYALNPSGYLFLGTSESASSSADLFKPIEKKHRIYVRCRPSAQRRHLPDLPLRVPKARVPKTRAQKAHVRRAREQLSLQNPDAPVASNADLHRQSLEAFAPPSVLVDENRDILHISDSANAYFDYPSGNPTYDILRAVRRELRLDLRGMLLEAFQEGKASVSRPIRVEINGEERHIHLMVRPSGEEENTKLALVLFVEGDPAMSALPEDGHDGDERVKRLEKELEHTRRQLETTVEGYESSETQLKAANEELQSINEEHESTLEELETSQEELQSVNEELQTVNSELNNKVEELSHANNDLHNLMASTDVATVFLNRQLEIERYTPQVEELFNIMERDQGRPLEHVTGKFVNYGTMVADARKVLETLEPIEREVQGEEDRWYLIRVLPYRTDEDQVDGVVITFVEITRLKRAQERASRIQERHQLLIDNVEEYGIFAVNQEGKIASWNPGAERIFGYTEDEILGEPTSIIFTEEDQKDDASIEELRIAREEGQAEDERWHVRKNGDRFWGSGVMIALRTDNGDLRGFAKVLRDNTERREALNALQENRKKLQALNETLEERVKQRTDELQRKNKQVRDLASQLVIAEQEERQRISQILHDDVQQHLYGLMMRITMLGDRLEDTSVDLRQQIDDAEGHLKEAIARTRNLTVDLSPPVLKGEGLVSALEWLKTQMDEMHDLQIEVKATEQIRPAEEEIRVLLFQVVRELLFNVVKHAETGHAVVELEKVDSHLLIRVSDDGVGCDPDEVLDRSRSEGFGLRHLNDRLDLFDGELKVESAPGEGTTVEVILPVAWSNDDPNEWQ